MELKIQNITKRYRDKTAVDDVSITLTPGVWGLLGANGAGKTTLMRMLAGILRPSSGRILCDGVEIGTLGAAYREKLGQRKAVLYGPAYKGISIAVSAAVALSRDGLDVPFFFNRKEAKDHGEGGVFVGYVPKAGEDVGIVEDVITAGTAIRESMAILSRLEGVKVAATFIMVDRKERGKGEKLAMEEVEEEFGFPVYSVVDVYDIIAYLEENPANAENVARIRNYLAVNGANA